MLVLKRKGKEKVNVYLGDKLIGKVHYFRHQKGVASLGFDFVSEVRFVRAEIDPNEPKPTKKAKA